MPRRAWKSAVARNLTVATGLPDAEMAMRQLARDALAEVEVVAEPVDLALVASFQGVRAIEVVEMAQAGRLIPEEGGYRIQLNASHSGRKRRFTTGHEIGHTLLPGYQSRPHLVQDVVTGQFDMGREEEFLCDVAAAELLLPDHLFRPAAQARGCYLEAVLELATRFEASREATARRLVDLNLWPCALVLWHQAYKKREAALTMQSTFGIEWVPPQPKLRVRYAVASATFGYFVPRQLSAPRDGLIEQCFADGGPQSGEEVLQIGGHAVAFYAMAVARDFVSDSGPIREVLCLLLSSGREPLARDEAPALWKPPTTQSRLM